MCAHVCACVSQTMWPRHRGAITRSYSLPGCFLLIMMSSCFCLNKMNHMFKPASRIQDFWGKHKNVAFIIYLFIYYNLNSS